MNATFILMACSFLLGFVPGVAVAVAIFDMRSAVKPFPVSDLGKGRINPLTGKPFLTKWELQKEAWKARPRRSDRVARPAASLAPILLPSDVTCNVLGEAGDELVLVHEKLNLTLIVGDNDRGGWGFKTPQEMAWHGNYPTMQDAARVAAVNGFKELSR